MITAVSAATTRNEVQSALHPLRQSGTSSFQTATQLKTKLKSALSPVQPAKATSSAAKTRNTAASKPRRQWSRARSTSPSRTPPAGTANSATSPVAKTLSRSICARSSFSARTFVPAAGPETTSASRYWVP